MKREMPDRDIAFLILDTAVLIFLLIALWMKLIDSRIIILGLILQVAVRRLFHEVSTSIRIKDRIEVRTEREDEERDV